MDSKIKNIVFLENSRVEDLYPFSVMHCSWELRVGTIRNFEKSQLYFPNSNLYFSGRENHLRSFLKRFKFENNLLNGKTLVIDGSISINSSFIEQIKNHIDSNENISFVFNNIVVASLLDSEEILNLNYEDIIEKLNAFKMIEINNIILSEYLWDTLSPTGNLINEESKLLPNLHHFSTADFQGVFAVNYSDIYVSKGVSIAPGTVLDAELGAIIIGENVKIMANSVIIGPCYIGNNSLVKVGAKIYQDCSFGEYCKVGGEIENTIIQSYSNKQHEGFLGHSYLCEWVNLGADTNNSDLKNTYSEISMRLPHKDVKTGRIFLGLLCGDHTKSGINTMFTTGTVAGVCGILVKEWFLPNYIKSFTWGGASNSPIYKFSKAIETSQIVMKRRNKELLDEEITLLKSEYDRQS